MNSVSRRELLVSGFCREIAEQCAFSKYIPDSVLLLITMNHPQLMIESDIITTALLEDQLYDILCAKIGGSQDRFTLNRIYSSRLYGIHGREFHICCDDTEYPSITLIRSKVYKKIFGGYTTVSWRANSVASQDKVDPFSFLFTFSEQYRGYEMSHKDRMHNVKSNIFELHGLSNDYNMEVIRCIPKKGPTFGIGCDLHITEDGKKCYSSPDSYDIPAASTLAGAEQFDVDIYEVFEMIQPNWNCKMCTFENKGIHSLCQVCFQPKDSTL